MMKEITPNTLCILDMSSPFQVSSTITWVAEVPCGLTRPTRPAARADGCPQSVESNIHICTHTLF